MAEVLKRWNGSEWVPVVAVNRIEIGGDGSGLISQPSHYSEWPPNAWPFNEAHDTLTANAYVATPAYSYTIS